MKQVDVRTIHPRERHPLLFRTFDELEAGQAFELVNDHDPKPLFYQFQMERPAPSMGVPRAGPGHLARAHKQDRLKPQVRPPAGQVS